jgi:hypothetical protein
MLGLGAGRTPARGPRWGGRLPGPGPEVICFGQGRLAGATGSGPERPAGGAGYPRYLANGTFSQVRGIGGPALSLGGGAGMTTLARRCRWYGIADYLMLFAVGGGTASLAC